ncbi:MAG TPA: DHHA1 domain-containing protein, partial [Gammaproteobacteria bacterium]
VAGRDARHLGAGDLGYALGPRLNAAGRLADMAIGVRCLLADTVPEAAALAGELDAFNRERREIERTMQEQAADMLASLRLDGELAPGLCLFNPAWHQGVVGILASRVKERVHRPVIAFASSGDGSLTGSARSVAGVHVRDVLLAVADRCPGLIERFGGHAMAAGLKLREADYPRFAAEFAAEVERVADPAALRGTLDSDGALAAAELTLETALALEQGGPWGQGFPEPLFDGTLVVRERRVLGEAHLRLVLGVPGGGSVDAIAFNAVPEHLPDPGAELDLAYRVGVNRYRGSERLQLIVEHIASQ